MKKYRTYLAVSLAMGFAWSAQATTSEGGSSVGNGGNVGVCFNDKVVVKEIKENGNRISMDHLDKITSIKALEIYEAEVKFNSTELSDKMMLSREDEAISDYLKRIINRYTKAIPELHLILKRVASEFRPENVLYYQEVGIDRIYDTGENYYLDPLKCVIATAIRQTEVEGFPHLEIDNRLFSHPKHSAQSRAILWLHETVLRWAIGIRDLEPSHTETANTRRVTVDLTQRSLISSTLFKSLLFNKFLGAEQPDQTESRYFIVPQRISVSRKVSLGYETLSRYFDYFQLSSYWDIFEKYFTPEFWAEGAASGAWTYNAYIYIQNNMDRCLADPTRRACHMLENDFDYYETGERLWRAERYRPEVMDSVNTWQRILNDDLDKLAHTTFRRGELKDRIEKDRKYLAEYQQELKSVDMAIAGYKADLDRSKEAMLGFVRKYSGEVEKNKAVILNDLLKKSVVLRKQMQKEIWLGPENIEKINQMLDCRIAAWEANESESCASDTRLNPYRVDSRIAVPEDDSDDSFTGINREECGTIGTTAERIANCKDDELAQIGQFVLVSKLQNTGSTYLDKRSGLLWSDKLSHEYVHSYAREGCDNLYGSWRVPTTDDFATAKSGGLAFLPNMSARFWTSTPNPGTSGSYYVYMGWMGEFSSALSNGSDTESVRCVTEAK